MTTEPPARRPADDRPPDLRPPAHHPGDRYPADPLTPAARALCDAMSAAFPRPEAGVAALRAAARAGVREAPAAAAASANGVPVRLYEGAEGGTDGELVVVFAHGGGWVLCDLDTHDRLCRTLASRTGATVVSVDYRRAPEHRFPAAEDDVHAVLEWAAGTYPGRPLVLAGDSSGGNLAAATALRARDRGGPPVAGQLLVYPVLDHRLDGDSARVFAEGHFHTTAHMRWYWQQYLGPDGDPAAASPGLADDVSGLPPALLVLADCDPLRDEGLAYARRLSAAGVPTLVQLHTGVFHGFLGGTGLLPEADGALDAAAAWLRTLLR
ncbi:alpha/beta hydrolase [Streptomyces sp. NPDC006482]|uniref:alpha/beta hydrolase n=1 Tax=Streptomyces sp. NPDC006482 TaxID=3154306 RepID=UPI0033A12ACB